jgi:hypothetical protein
MAILPRRSRGVAGRDGRSTVRDSALLPVRFILLVGRGRHVLGEGACGLSPSPARRSLGPLQTAPETCRLDDAGGVAGGA